MHRFEQFNSPASFGLAVAGLILAVASMGRLVNSFHNLLGEFEFWPGEGKLLSEAAINGLFGIGCFYLACGIGAALRRPRVTS